MLFAERRQVLPDGYKEFLLPLEYIDFAFPFRCISLYCMLLGIFYPVVSRLFSVDHNTCEDPDQKIGRGGSGHDKASGFLLCGIRFYRFSCVDGDVSILLRNGEDAAGGLVFHQPGAFARHFRWSRLHICTYIQGCLWPDSRPRRPSW